MTRAPHPGGERRPSRSLAYDRAMAGGDELRKLMRRFPSGISVVTVDAEPQPLGLTLGSLVALSLEPPLVGISIGLQSALHEPLRQAGAFAISLLAADQEAIAQHFARSGVPLVALWRGIETRPSGVGAPLLAGALGWLECRTWARYAAGDHTLFLGEVLAVEEGEPGLPLLYLQREYRSP